MITLQHSLMMLLSVDGDMEQFKKEIAYALLPDAIRAYSGPRPYSHFEKSEDGQISSWMKFPLDVKNLSKDAMEQVDKFLVPNIRPCCLGEDTDIMAFKIHNKHLPDNYYNGVQKHLIQDMCFDKFVREQIDCSDKYNGNFEILNRKMNDKEVRAFIADMENYGFYILSKIINSKYNITPNQEWFDQNVKPILDEIYPQDLSDNTYKYMKIPERINDLITNHDFSEIGRFIIPVDDYLEMYGEAIDEMRVQPKRRQIIETQETSQDKSDLTTLIKDSKEKQVETQKTTKSKEPRILSNKSADENALDVIDNWIM